MRPILAIRAFFAALFGSRLPAEVIPQNLLPAQLPPGETNDPSAAEKPEPPEEPKTAEPPEPEVDLDAAAVQVLAVLQSEGRLLDFLGESIDDYEDADVGAAVREVHRGCNKALADHFDLGPVRTEEEDALVTVDAGYDPSEVRLVGNIVGQPPFSGTLRHRGWRAASVRLPKTTSGARIVQPAEIEV